MPWDQTPILAQFRTLMQFQVQLPVSRLSRRVLVKAQKFQKPRLWMEVAVKTKALRRWPAAVLIRRANLLGQMASLICECMVTMRWQMVNLERRPLQERQICGPMQEGWRASGILRWWIRIFYRVWGGVTIAQLGSF